MDNFNHVSILLKECVENLNINPEGVYIDATLGGAGHSYHIAKRLTTGKLICLDKDEDAISNAKKKLSKVMDKVVLYKGDFKDIDSALSLAGYKGADGILFDLGVSSPQLDNKDRGFSYMRDAPLDMRMDRQSSFCAKDVVNTWSVEELKRILFDYAEERYAPLIARGIVNARADRNIETTFELVDIIKSAMPKKALNEKQHPAKRSFQAIRIAVNDELSSVKEAMDKSVMALNKGGKLCVITFHSLEDRIVKAAYNAAARGCICPKEFPVCICSNMPKVRIINKKPILPGATELHDNPRARSAKLRVCERI